MSEEVLTKQKVLKEYVGGHIRVVQLPPGKVIDPNSVYFKHEFHAFSYSEMTASDYEHLKNTPVAEDVLYDSGVQHNLMEVVHQQVADFYSEIDQPKAPYATVNELIRLLQTLPGDSPVYLRLFGKNNPNDVVYTDDFTVKSEDGIVVIS